MKTTELMIGDWVYNKNIDKPMQVYPMMFSQMFRRTPDALYDGWDRAYIIKEKLKELKGK